MRNWCIGETCTGMIYFEELKLDYLEIAVLSQNNIWNRVIGVIMQTFLVRY